MAVRIASRSFSLAAQANISSSVFGGWRTSKRPSARPGAWAQSMISARPSTASRPRCSDRCSTSRSGSVWKSIGAWSPMPMLAERTAGSKIGHSPNPSSSKIWLGSGNCTEPASSNW